jgi:hypothetical protein
MKINLIKHQGNLIPHSQEDREKVNEFKDGAIYQVSISNMDKRTIAQNRLYHRFMKNIAERLNEQDLKVVDVIRYETEWTMEKVKEMIFKPVVKSLYNKDSTTKLNKDEFDLIADTIIQALALKGVDTKGLLDE